MENVSKYAKPLQIGLVVLCIAGIINLVRLHVTSDPGDQPEVKEQPVVNLKGHQLLQAAQSNIYGTGPRVNTTITGLEEHGAQFEMDRDLLHRFWDVMELEGLPDINDLLDCLLLESGFSPQNLEEKKELVSLFGEYVDLIQNAKLQEPLPVLLFVGGSKNMQTFFSGTDLIEFILAASYLKRELIARNINVKVAPAYDLGTGKNGVREHLDSLIKTGKQVATTYPGALPKWHEEVKSFTDKHREDMPEYKTIQASIISLLIDLEQSHVDHGNQPALHLVFVSHGYKYRVHEKQKNFEDADRVVRLVPMYKTYDHVQETGLITVSTQISEVDGGPKALYYYYVDKKLGNVVTGNIGCHSEVGGKTYGYIDQMTRQLVKEMKEVGP